MEGVLSFKIFIFLSSYFPTKSFYVFSVCSIFTVIFIVSVVFA